MKPSLVLLLLFYFSAVNSFGICIDKKLNRALDTIESKILKIRNGVRLNYQDLTRLEHIFSRSILPCSSLKITQEMIKEILKNFEHAISNRLWLQINIIGHCGADSEEKETYLNSIREHHYFKHRKNDKYLLFELNNLITSSSIKKNLALSFFKKIDASGQHSSFVLINGGSRNEPNYSIFEVELKTFDKHLFFNKSSILNGGGLGNTRPIKTNNSKLVVLYKNGKLLRQNSIIRKNFKATSIENLNYEVKRIKDGGIQQATFLYSGHGSKNGISFYSGESINTFSLNQIYDKLDKSTVIRSIFLGCYSGAMVTLPQRGIAITFNRFIKFIKYHYPKNRCALAKASHDETTKPLVSGNNIDNNPWSKFLIYNPEVSLSDIKHFLTLDFNTFSTPSTTSDYLLLDVEKHICSNIDPANSLYDYCLNDNLIFQKEHINITKQEELFKELMRNWINDLYPNKKRLLDKLKLKAYNLKQRKPQTNNEELKLLMKQIDDLQEFLSLSIYSKENVSYFNHKIIEFFSDHTNYDSFPLLKNVILSNSKNNSIFEDIDTIFYIEKGLKAGRRKKETIERRKIREKYLLEVLREQKYNEINEIYKNIKECENSSLR